MQKTSLVGLTIVAIVVVAIAACTSGDDGMAEVVLEATQRQAEHNQVVTEANREVAKGSKELVSADAAARQELVKLQRELHGDLDEIGRQRDALEAERVEAARERRQESTLGPAIFGLCILLACLAPLVLAGLAMRDAGDPPSLTEIEISLIDEASEQQVLPSLEFDEPIDGPPQLP